MNKIRIKTSEKPSTYSQQGTQHIQSQRVDIISQYAASGSPRVADICLTAGIWTDARFSSWSGEAEGNYDSPATSIVSFCGSIHETGRVNLRTHTASSSYKLTTKSWPLTVVDLEQVRNGLPLRAIQYFSHFNYLFSLTSVTYLLLHFSVPMSA